MQQSKTKPTSKKTFSLIRALKEETDRLNQSLPEKDRLVWPPEMPDLEPEPEQSQDR